jgi:hypothetical protein
MKVTRKSKENQKENLYPIPLDPIKIGSIFCFFEIITHNSEFVEFVNSQNAIFWEMNPLTILKAVYLLQK